MNVIAYRMPEGMQSPDISLNGREISKVFSSEGAVIFEVGQAQKLGLSVAHPSFVVAPFDPDDEGFVYPLLQPLESIPQECLGTNKIDFIFPEKSENDYSRYIERIVTFLDSDPYKKVVASRRETFRLSTSPDNLFSRLCNEYPDTFVFFISTREFGTWIGASPELLLAGRGDKLITMALAGTRKAGSVEEWDEKNILEQNIVTLDISSVFNGMGIPHEIGALTTHKAGEIEHLKTQISASLPPASDPVVLLRQLSPTPALAGYPKSDALKIIRDNEGDRALYGGFCGPVFPSGDFILNVILRCGFISCFSKPKITLFAGGGVTCYSSPAKEWTETVNKFQTLKKFL